MDHRNPTVQRTTGLSALHARGRWSSPEARVEPQAWDFWPGLRSAPRAHGYLATGLEQVIYAFPAFLPNEGQPPTPPRVVGTIFSRKAHERFRQTAISESESKPTELEWRAMTSRNPPFRY